MATSRDIQEIISMISSDKVKIREDGVLLLSSWMEGERSVSFCRLLGKNTARLKTGEIPHAETWPFLLTMLTNCIALEISSSKKRPPKLALAKTVRKVIQFAEDAKLSGKTLLLLSVVKPLFNHIWDVIRDVPTFQSEYGIILRQLLSVKEYRLRMRKRVYCSLVLLYMNKIETALSAKNSIRSNTKDEIFRFIATLHSLLENPPGDFPDTLRDDLVKAFVMILSQVREEWKILCKLVECINTFLLQDGPNLGCQTKDIHNALQDFMIRFWLTTHDRALKNALVLYARIQLKLSRSFIDGSLLIEQLLDMLVKELDQSSSVAGAPRDDKGRTLANSQHGLMELAASVFYQTCVNVSKEPSTEKRLKREHSAGHLKDGLMKGKWSWYTVFYFLLHNYSSSLSNALLIYWFEGICESFESVLNVGNKMHAYDGLIWVLRSSFGIKLIISSKEKLVSASEVLAAGVQPRPIMETVIVTLAHLAYCSAKVELEAIFMMSTVAAINPCLRELVYALLDNLSKRLQYTNRAKYFEQLMGSILFCWVACGVSLAALVQIQELFVVKSEPHSFMQYCCPWLLPSLILSGKSKDLDWVSMVASQPLSVLVKKHFVSIFAVCMALHCSEKSNKDKGTAVLRSSILQIAEISEHEQDNLIKKHLVSIVSCLLSLSSSSSDPAIPYFPKGTIVLAVQTAVDGFLDMDDHPMATAVVDKIQLFRPDRVFMFLVEIHYQITSAVHPRHRCHQLSAVEVLINIIGHRAAISSTSW